MSDNIFLQAWNEIVEDREVAQECYLSIYQCESYYGGPEEGGWWCNTFTNNSSDGGSGIVIIRIKIKSPDVKLLVNGETLINSNLILSHLPFNFINSYSNSSLISINNTNEPYVFSVTSE